MCKTTPCLEGDGSHFNRTHLQQKITNIRHGKHYHHYPLHCDLVHDMLHFDAEKRMKCQQIKCKIENVCCDRKELMLRRQSVKDEYEALQKSEENVVPSEDPIIPALIALRESTKPF